MLINETQTHTNEFEIRRDGEIDPTFKRKVIIKRTKAVLRHTAAVGLDYATWLVFDPWKRVGAELKHQVKLELFDMVHGTHLHSQYKAGRRTQMILAAKRAHGLI